MNQNYLKIQKNLGLGKNIAFDLDVTITELERLFPVTNEANALDHFYGRIIPLLKSYAAAFIVNPMRFMSGATSLHLDLLFIKFTDDTDIPVIVELDGINDERIAQQYVVSHLFNGKHVAGVIIPATTPMRAFAVIARENGKILFVNPMIETIDEIDACMRPKFFLSALYAYFNIVENNQTDTILGVDMPQSSFHQRLLKDYFDMKKDVNYLIMEHTIGNDENIIRIPLSIFFPNRNAFDDQNDITKEAVYEKITQNLKSYLLKSETVTI